MNTLLKKMNAPDEFPGKFGQFLGVKTVLDSSEIPFSLIFCTKLSEIENLGWLRA
jgi:hypothetical protein